MLSQIKSFKLTGNSGFNFIQSELQMAVLLIAGTQPGAGYRAAIQRYPK
ncbi:hypothetical protein LTSEALA_2968 [Salmonella enterica subsp. enterica serovar Alachua str. R6-377]|uniref:Uncharacterized protein n=1 Tax=Salmonella enterica subsp. enterica serovar Alachua str. R6-377 TaxID=913241 RepID=G5LQA0_SALET|nr:hypothetical protein LTSEALA_2968 [Salmonella enterica subsp. enterica serovar Alachua str. R6-377]